MCTTHNNEATKKFRKKNKNKKEVIVWKIYYKNSNSALTHLYANKHGAHANIYRGQEEIVSNRIGKDYDPSDHGIEVNRGIHVFTTRKKAREYKLWYLSYSARIFKCTAKMADLVSVSLRNEAVFMKIRLPKKEFDKGMKGRN